MTDSVWSIFIVPLPHHTLRSSRSRLPLLLLVSLLSIAMRPALALLHRAAPTRGVLHRRLLLLLLLQPQQRVFPQRAFRATPTCGLKVDIHIRGKRTGGEVRCSVGQSYLTVLNSKARTAHDRSGSTTRTMST